LTLIIIPACGGGGGSSVTPKTWGTPVAIETDTDRTYETRVAVDDSGTTVVVWDRENAANERFTMANYHTAATGWVGAEQISDASGTNTAYPKIAAGGNTTIAIWKQGTDKIVVNRFDSSTLPPAWGAQETISTTSGGFSVKNPEIAVNGSGNAVAVWIETNPGPPSMQSVVTCIYDASTGTWGTPAGIYSYGGAISSVAPKVAMDDSGNVIVVWESDHDIYAKRYDPITLTWYGEIHLENAAGFAYLPEIAMNGTGDAIAVWFQYDGTVDNVIANRFVPGSGWQGAVPIESYDVTASSPQIAINASGTAMVVWSDWNDDIWANIYTPGSGWGAEEKIHQVAGYYVDPRVAMNDNEDGVVVWYNDTGGIIMANRYSSASGWGEAEILSDLTYESWYPYVAIDSAGNATAVWERDMSPFDVMAARLE